MAPDELSACWRIFERALEAGYVQGPDDLRELEEVVTGSSPYSDLVFEELQIERQGPRVRVSLLGDSASCPADEFAAAIRRLGQRPGGPR